MDIKSRIAEDLKTAMRERDATRLSTLRLINAAIKDREIALRGAGGEGGVGEGGIGEVEILGILGRMVKSRQESVRAYEEGGRLELAEKERAEIAVIEDYLPRPLSPDEIEAAVNAAIAEAGAASVRDMGRVMAILKARYTGRMDFGAVGPMVKARLV